MAEVWHIEPLDQRRVCQKRRRTAGCEPQTLDQLPAEWRDLLTKWVRRGGNSRWETLLKDSGATERQRADDLLHWLLKNGWAAVTEQWKLGDWWPQQVELLHLPRLRAGLGLRDPDDDTQRWQGIRAALDAALNDTFAPALLALDELPVNRALARHDLIAVLQRWQEAQQSGTRRDFALFARGDTKAVGNAEWDWLETLLDLAEFRIERHTPLLLVSAPLILHTAQGRLDLAACADFAALTPASITHAQSASGTIKHWHLIENRTSFERVARQRKADVGVVWLPGFPPNWWCEAMSHLLDLAPAPALLSCDPDPAGIAIALKAATLWQERRLEWQPWKMSAADLAALPIRKPLNDADRKQLAALQTAPPLPSTLAALAEWMLKQGEKGEQEGYL